jgi:CheY-like chemotaxis protein
VKSILEGGQSLLLLINDILDLSKLQAGRMELKAEPTHLKDLLKFMERLFQETCSSKGIRMRLEYQEDLPSTLVLDSVRLRQVLMNLIGNAVKFTEEGEVLVKASGVREPGRRIRWAVKLEISDTGPGIDTQDLNHIFEPFYQSNTLHAAHKKGTGLGLSIVQRFVKLMNGELHVTSKEGKGSVFTLLLKDLSVSARLVPEKNLNSGHVDFDRLKPSLILAVDDNGTNLELIREIFSGTHHRVITAENGEDAINLIRDKKPDLVLMDLRMPVKDGPTAAREIKTEAEYKLTPIIAVTAGSMPGGHESPLLGEDFDGALRKPFTRQEMYDALALFLKEEPRQRRRDSDAKEAFSPPSVRVLGKLRELLDVKWPEVKSRMSMSEVVEFSEELSAVTEGDPCTRVQDYACKLKGAAESFSFGEMESVLGHFPDLVAELEEAK